MTLIKPPNGYSELLTLGDPRKFLRKDGTIDSIAWENSLGLVLIEFPEPLQLSFGKPYQTAHGMKVHPLSAAVWSQAFTTLEAENLWSELHTFGGSFSFRQQRGSDTKISTHAWGLAGDFDVLNNTLGDSPKMNLAIVQIFESIGFTWGGRWKRPDGMHFQYVANY